MKQPKRPTRDHKEIIAKNDLDPTEWRVVSQDRASLIIIDGAGNIKTLAKE